VHLVLGSQRHDLRDRTVVIARVDRPVHPVPGADALWAGTVDGVDLRALTIAVGADASDAADVHRLADAGAAAVALAPGDRTACAAAAQRELTVLVPLADAGAAVASLPPDRVLVAHGSPVADGTTCFTPPGEGPAAWAAATRALAAGVRVVRTAEPRSMRRVATVVERLVAARQGSER